MEGGSHETIYQWIWQEKPVKTQTSRICTNTSNMADDGVKGAIITTPEGFSSIAWVSNNVRKLSTSVPVSAIWKPTS